MTTPWRIAAFALWALLAASAAQAQIKFTLCMPSNTAPPTTLDANGKPIGYAYYIGSGVTSDYSVGGTTSTTINGGVNISLGTLQTSGADAGKYLSSFGLISGGTYNTPLCLRNDGTLNFTVLTTKTGGEAGIRSAMGLTYTDLLPNKIQMVNTGTINWVKNEQAYTSSLGMMTYTTALTQKMVIPTATADLVEGNTGIYNLGTLQWTNTFKLDTSVRGINVTAAGFLNDVFNSSQAQILLDSGGAAVSYARGIYVTGQQGYIHRLTNNGLISTTNGTSASTTTLPISPIPIAISQGSAFQYNWNPNSTTGNNGVYVDTVLNTGTLIGKATNATVGIGMYWVTVNTVTNTGAIQSEGAGGGANPTSVQFWTGIGTNTFNTLNNLQGDWNKSWTQGSNSYSRTTGPLTYSGYLPTNYNTIVYGANQYGQFLGLPNNTLQYADALMNNFKWTSAGINYGNAVMNYGIYGGRGSTTDVTGLTYNKEFGTYVTGSRLENNTYKGVLQFQTASGASAYINANSFTGKFYNAYSGVVNWRLMQGADTTTNVTTTNTTSNNKTTSNFNLLVNDATGYVQGYVFNDAGDTSANANDGMKNASTEIGLAGVTITLTDCGSTTYDSTQTDANGFYRFTSPRDASNHSLWRKTLLCVNADAPQGYAVTGASARPSTGSLYNTVTSLGNGANGAVTVDNTAYTYAYTRGSSTQQVVSFTTPDEDSYQLRVDFGRVPTSTLASPSTQGVVPGSTVTHAFRFRPGTRGSLNVSALAAQATPSSISAWGVTLYQDSSCSGAYSSSMPVLSNAVAVTQGSDVCFVVRATVPAGVAMGTSYSLPLQAVLTYDTLSLAETLSTTATTAVSSTPVLLTKQVRNVTANGAAGTSSNAKSGETLEYTVTFINMGTALVRNIVINEATTNWTTLANATVTTTLPAGMTCSSMKTPDNPSGTSCTALTGASKGALSFAFSGDLNPGQSGVLTYKVKVD